MSPSTVFRYFPTKPDLVMYDNLDDEMIGAFRAQPPDISTIQAFRATFREGFGRSLREQIGLQRERLIRTVPELRATMIDELTRTIREIIDVVAERSGRSTDDVGVVAPAGAVIGVAIGVWLAGDSDD